jgi:choline-sulfatase
LSDRCNILFLMADQFRHDALRHVGEYGRTDCLDGLAAEGVSFRRAVTNSPECMPARFALATGLYPHQTGVWRNAPLTLSPASWSWTQALAKAGYRTSLFGKTHFHESAQPSGDLRDGLELMRGYGLLDVDEIAGPRASMRILCEMTEGWQRRGLWEAYRRDFEERFATKPWIARPSPLGAEQYYDTYVGRRALDYLSAYDRPEPWFCWVSFAGPHEPWDAPIPYDRIHASAEAPMALPRMCGAASVRGLLAELFRAPGHAAPADENEIAAMRANYAGNVSLIDDQIGALVDFLKRAGLYDDTLILFTSDHGEMNGDQGLIYKGNFLASAVDIPFILRPPKSSAAVGPISAAAMVELIDAGATILDYAGIEPPAWSNGRSLRPLIEGRRQSHRPYVVSEFGRHSMIATREWKCEFDAEDRAALLFDRLDDPDEQRNRVEGPEAAEVLARFRALLLAHRSATADRFAITQ